MDISQKTDSGVYIIESLDFDDENAPKEGKMVADILEMSGINNKYVYIRTKGELIHFVDDFVDSNFRFLHLSFHGNQNSISTTLDNISHVDLGEILKNKLKYRRLFMSACSSVNDSLAHNLMKVSKCNSIIGSGEDVYMDEIAIFWATFYHLMFKNNPSAMKKKDIVDTLFKLVELYDIPFNYYKKSSVKPYYNKVEFSLSQSKPNFSDYEENDSWHVTRQS